MRPPKSATAFAGLPEEEGKSLGLSADIANVAISLSNAESSFVSDRLSFG